MFIDYDTVKAFLDANAIDKKVEIFTRDFFYSIIGRLKWFLALMLVLSEMVFFLREKLINKTSQLIEEINTRFSELIPEYRSWISNEDKMHLMSLGLIILTGIIIRIFCLYKTPIRYDEAFTFIMYVSKSLILGIANYSYFNNHILHTITSHFIYETLGSSLWVVRLTALILGIVLIPAAYIVFKRFANKNIRLLTSSIVAGSFLLIDYSCNARGYTLMTLMAVLSLGALNSYIKNRQLLSIFLFVCFSVLGIYAVPVYLVFTAAFWDIHCYSSVQ